MKLNKIFGLALLSVFCLFACDDSDDDCNKCIFKVADMQFKKDYDVNKISDLKWEQKGDYVLASFNTDEAGVSLMRVWYDVDDDYSKATRVKEAKKYALSSLPEAVKNALEASQYGNVELWKIDEVELEENFVGGVYKAFYEVELSSVTIIDLEAELIIDPDKQEILFAREEKDDSDDTDDNDEDTYIVNEQLLNAVHKIYPDAVILEAEVEDGKIEVDAYILDENNSRIELELYFNFKYEPIGEESEAEYIYKNLPEKYNAVREYFKNNTDGCPEPSENTKVEVEINRNNVIIEFDDYVVDGKEWEVTITLNHEYVFVKAEIEND